MEPGFSMPEALELMILLLHPVAQDVTVASSPPPSSVRLCICHVNLHLQGSNLRSVLPPVRSLRFYRVLLEVFWLLINHVRFELVYPRAPRLGWPVLGNGLLVGQREDAAIRLCV